MDELEKARHFIAHNRILLPSALSRAAAPGSRIVRRACSPASQRAGGPGGERPFRRIWATRAYARSPRDARRMRGVSPTWPWRDMRSVEIFWACRAAGTISRISRVARTISPMPSISRVKRSRFESGSATSTARFSIFQICRLPRTNLRRQKAYARRCIAEAARRPRSRPLALAWYALTLASDQLGHLAAARDAIDRFLELCRAPCRIRNCQAQGTRLKFLRRQNTRGHSRSNSSVALSVKSCVISSASWKF
jgi:hypothetical protein